MPLPSAITSASSGHATTATAPAAAVADVAPHQQQQDAARRRDDDGGGIKGNSGAGQRRRRGRDRYYACAKCVIWTGLVLGAYQTLWTYWLAGVNVPDREVDAVTGRERIRRRPDLLVKHDPVKGISVPTSPVDGILEGYLTLIRIDLPPGGGLVPGRARKSSAGTGGGEETTNTIAQQQAPPAYTGVQGVFCHVSWKLQKDSPAAYPFFLDLQKSSTMCPSTTVTVDLWRVTQQAREYDARHNHTLAANQPPSQSGNKKKTKFKFGSQLPRAVIFHESKCGSTVVSNVLQAYQTKMTRVYSEPPAPLQAIMACHRKKRLQQDPRQPPIVCDEGAHEQLIRDVFYIMGRTDKLHVKHQHVFYKISSMSTLALDAFVRAMPNTPWAFVYRDPVEVLMSHFPHYQKQQQQDNAGVDSVALLGKDHRNQQATCLRTYKAPNQPTILERVVDAAQHKAVEDLDPVEYCAAYLAALCQAALEEYQRTGNERGVKHFFMDHQELPYAIWETMLPALMGPLKHEDIDTLHAVAKVYSHTGTGTNNKKSNSILDGITSSSTSTSSTQQQQKQRWKEDSTLKQGKAPAVIKRAAETFMYPVYKQLNKVRKELEERYRHGGQ